MANILEEIDSRSSESARYSALTIGVVGALLGVVFWGLTILLEKFMIEPIFCKATVSSCSSSIGIAGDISTIIVATIGIVIMISLKMARPLIVAVSSAISLWSLAIYTNGLSWVEAIFWSIWLYAIAYILFSWIARYMLIKPVLITMLAIVVLARLALI